MSENVQSKKEVLEVEVIIPEEVLKQNEELSDLYDVKKKVIRYDVAPETTKKLREQLTQMVKTSNVNDLVAFNPVIAALNYIQSFKELKYDPEKKNDQEYTDAKTKIGKFNAAVTKTAKAIKDPHTQYNKMLIELEKLLKEESDNVRSSLDTNFKVYIDEKAKAEAARTAKKDKEKNDIIENLSTENAANLQKLSNQQKETRKVEIENIINKVGIDVGLKVPSLNLEGLKAYRQQILDSKMGDVDTPDIEFTSEEKTVFSQSWATALLSAVNVIDMAIKSLETAAENSKVITENTVLKANTPTGVFTVDDDDLPFNVPQPTPPAPEIPEVFVPVTDEEKLAETVKYLTEMNDVVKAQYTAIMAFEFEDVNIQKIQKKLDTSVQNILDWSEKTMAWTQEKQTLYINFLNSQKNEA